MNDIDDATLAYREGIDTAGEESPAVSPDEEFAVRVAAIAEAIKDEDKFRQCIAEIYIFLNDMDTAVRSVMSAGGPMKLLAGMMGRKREGEEESG